MVSEPVANIVGVTCVDEDWNLLNDAGYQSVKGFHPVTLEEEVPIDIEIAAVVGVDFDAKARLDFRLVEPLRNVAELRVAEVAAVLAFTANVINILACTLVGTDHSIVAINGCRDTRPDALTFVTVLDQRLAAGKSIVH